MYTEISTKGTHYTDTAYYGANSNVHGQVGELSGSNHDAVCVHGRAEKRNFTVIHH